MVDIESKNSNKKGINLLNHLFKRRSKRNLNEMIKCLKPSNSSNDKLDYLLSRSLNNVNELNDNPNDLNKLDLNDNHENNQKKNKNDANQLELIRRLSTPVLPNNQQEKDELKINKKLSLKSRRSFSPKSKLIINNSNKKLSIDQELLEHYNQLSTECNSSYMSLVSNSPISPLIKSIDQDIEALTLSRTDNPFIQSKLEKLSCYSGVNHDILSISNLSLNGGFINTNSNCSNVHSTNTLNNIMQQSNCSNQSAHFNQFSQSNKTSSMSSEELDEILNFGKSNKEDSLHNYLIRSPPPDFPENFSEFIFPQVGSPLRSLSTKYNNSINSDDTNTPNIKTPKFLSPLKQSKTAKSSPKRDNLFFANLNKSRLKKPNGNQLSSNENDVELIITS